MIYTFHDYELDTSRYELRHAGEPVSIIPKAFDLLAFLVEHYGQVVSKESLHNHLWPEQFVSESALTYHIATARKAIGDSGQNQQFIKTIYSRGYRFVVPVEEHEDRGQAIADADAAPELTWTASDDAIAPVVQPIPLPPLTTPVESAVEQVDERRPLTALWCSLSVTSTLGLALDPEDRHEIMQHAQSVCREVIQQLGGYPAQQLGHGLLAYFGYPHAREDAAPQAVRTGLRLVQAVQRLSQHDVRIEGAELTVRIALHSDIVVIEGVHQEHATAPLAQGDVPHMAAQLSSLASPNTMVLSAATQRVVEGYFICDNLGDYFIEELAQSTVVYQVLGESGAQSRIEAAAATRLTPFVGREQELGLLQTRWEQAQEGLVD